MQPNLIRKYTTTGFSFPVFDAQLAFRSIMNAMSRPGTIYKIELEFTPPQPLARAAAAAILALCDFETALWVAPKLEGTQSIIDYCLFHTGAKQVAFANAAQFAVLDFNQQNVCLADFSQGTAEYPDSSAMIIALTASLRNGRSFQLSGPGIQGQTDMTVTGLPEDFAAQWARNNAGFPLGVDVLLCAGTEFLALPRSTRIFEKG